MKQIDEIDDYVGNPLSNLLASRGRKELHRGSVTGEGVGGDIDEGGVRGHRVN